MIKHFYKIDFLIERRYEPSKFKLLLKLIVNVEHFVTLPHVFVYFQEKTLLSCPTCSKS